MWVCKSPVNLTCCLYPGSQKHSAGLPLPFLDISQELSCGWTSIHLYLCCRTAQDHQASAPNLHRAVLSCHYSSSRERASHFPSRKRKSIALAPKPLAVRYLTVCFPWKWLIKQLLQKCIYMWIAHVQSQPACTYKRSRPARIKFPSPFKNSSVPFLSIFLSHLHTQKLQKPPKTISTLNKINV